MGHCSYWQSSPFVALRECFPQYDWKEWLFHISRAVLGLAGQLPKVYALVGGALGYTRLDDWYSAPDVSGLAR